MLQLLMLMLLIHLHDNVHHRVSPVPPGGLAATAKALANADPIVSIGSHPHEVTRGFRQPLNPSHGFKHLIDVAWRGIKAKHGLIVCSQSLKLGPCKGRPNVIKPLHTGPWQAPCGAPCVQKARCHILDLNGVHGAPLAAILGAAGLGAAVLEVACPAP